MGTILPFLRPRDGSFDDATTLLIGEAFDAACAQFRNVSNEAREVVADLIIDAAMRGERDPSRLRDAGMAALGKQLN